MRFRGRWLAALAVAVTLVGACSGDDSDDGDPGTTEAAETSESTSSTDTSSSSTTDPDAAVEAEVEAAYLAQWDAYVEILGAPDPSNPLIDQHYTGASKAALLDTITQLALDGTAIRLPDDPSNFEVQISDIDPTVQAATVHSCVVDGLVVFKRDTGEIVNDRVVTTIFEAKLEESDGAWRLSEHIVVDDQEGRGKCVG